MHYNMTCSGEKRGVSIATHQNVPVPEKRCCVLPRALPVVEAMMAMTIADALLEKLGGDNIKELTRRFGKLPMGYLADISLRKQPRKLEYA